MRNEEYGKIPATLIWVGVVVMAVAAFAVGNLAYLFYNIVKVVTNG